MSARPCHWYDDADGGRWLIPGCAGRAQDPDNADACGCPDLATQLAAARKEIADLKRGRDGLQTWHDHIVRAVYGHPDGIKIMKAAADRAGDGR